MDNNNIGIVPSDWAPDNSMIKVVGVGGGGCNAVTYMFNKKIKGCSFVVCNTDSQALQRSTVPVKIQMGHGRGAGTDPTKGRNAALESQDEIAAQVLDNGTEMLFITAGMGGGSYTPESIKDPKQVRHIFVSCGSKENPDGVIKSAEALNAAGIKATSFVSEGTAHEFLTWRRALKAMAPLLFK